MTAALRTRVRGSRADEHRAGFMLVEILVTMAISAFLLVALASVTGLTLRALTKISGLSDRLEGESRLLSSLSRDLSRAERIRWATPEGDFVFRGLPAELIYAEQTTGPQGASTTKIVRLRSVSSRGRSLLDRSEAPYVPGIRSLEDLRFAQPTLLYTGERSVRFAYSAPQGEGTESLTDDWTSAMELPVAIRVALTDDDQISATLRIPLMVSSEPACAVSDARNCTRTEEEKPVAGAGGNGETIDPDDPLGWMRYAQ